MAEGASSFWWKCVDLHCGGGNCSASYVAVFLFSIMIMVFFDNMVMVVWLPSMWLNDGWASGASGVPEVRDCG